VFEDIDIVVNAFISQQPMTPALEPRSLDANAVDGVGSMAGKAAVPKPVSRTKSQAHGLVVQQAQLQQVASAVVVQLARVRLLQAQHASAVKWTQLTRERVEADKQGAKNKNKPAVAASAGTSSSGSGGRGSAGSSTSSRNPWIHELMPAKAGMEAHVTIDRALALDSRNRLGLLFKTSLRLLLPTSTNTAAAGAGAATRGARGAAIDMDPGPAAEPSADELEATLQELGKLVREASLDYPAGFRPTLVPPSMQVNGHHDDDDVHAAHAHALKSDHSPSTSGAGHAGNNKSGLGPPAQLAEAYLLRASLLFSRHRVGEALKDLMAAAALRPTLTHVWTHVAHTLLSYYSDAKRCIVAASMQLQRQPWEPSGCQYSLYLRAEAHSRKGDSAGALKDYSWLLMLNPTDGLAHLFKGKKLLEAKNGRLALNSFIAFVEASPPTAESHTRRGKAFRLLGKFARAASEFEEALHEEGTSENYIRMARACVAAGNTDLALQLAQRAYQSDAGSPHSLVCLSEIYGARGEYDLSLEMAREAVGLSPAPKKAKGGTKTATKPVLVRRGSIVMQGGQATVMTYYQLAIATATHALYSSIVEMQQAEASEQDKGPAELTVHFKRAEEEGGGKKSKKTKGKMGKAEGVQEVDRRKWKTELQLTDSRLRQRLQAALAAFDKCVEQQETANGGLTAKYWLTRVHRAELHYLLHNYSAACTDYSAAISAARHYTRLHEPAQLPSSPRSKAQHMVMAGMGSPQKGGGAFFGKEEGGVTGPVTMDMQSMAKQAELHVPLPLLIKCLCNRGALRLRHLREVAAGIADLDTAVRLVPQGGGGGGKGIGLPSVASTSTPPALLFNRGSAYQALDAGGELLTPHAGVRDHYSGGGIVQALADYHHVAIDGANAPPSAAPIKITMRRSSDVLGATDVSAVPRPPQAARRSSIGKAGELDGATAGGGGGGGRRRSTVRAAAQQPGQRAGQVSTTIEMRHNCALALLAVGENERAYAELQACLHTVSKQSATLPLRWLAKMQAVYMCGMALAQVRMGTEDSFKRGKKGARRRRAEREHSLHGAVHNYEVGASFTKGRGGGCDGKSEGQILLGLASAHFGLARVHRNRQAEAVPGVVLDMLGSKLRREEAERQKEVKERREVQKSMEASELNKGREIVEKGKETVSEAREDGGANGGNGNDDAGADDVSGTVLVKSGTISSAIGEGGEVGSSEGIEVEWRKGRTALQQSIKTLQKAVRADPTSLVARLGLAGACVQAWMLGEDGKWGDEAASQKPSKDTKGTTVASVVAKPQLLQQPAKQQSAQSVGSKSKDADEGVDDAAAAAVAAAHDLAFAAAIDDAVSGVTVGSTDIGVLRDQGPQFDEKTAEVQWDSPHHEEVSVKQDWQGQTALDSKGSNYFKEAAEAQLEAVLRMASPPVSSTSPQAPAGEAASVHHHPPHLQERARTNALARARALECRAAIRFAEGKGKQASARAAVADTNAALGDLGWGPAMMAEITGARVEVEDDTNSDDGQCRGQYQGRYSNKLQKHQSLAPLVASGGKGTLNDLFETYTKDEGDADEIHRRHTQVVDKQDISLAIALDEKRTKEAAMVLVPRRGREETVLIITCLLNRASYRSSMSSTYDHSHGAGALAASGGLGQHTGGAVASVHDYEWALRMLDAEDRAAADSEAFVAPTHGDDDSDTDSGSNDDEGSTASRAVSSFAPSNAIPTAKVGLDAEHRGTAGLVGLGDADHVARFRPDLRQSAHFNLGCVLLRRMHEPAAARAHFDASIELEGHDEGEGGDLLPRCLVNATVACIELDTATARGAANGAAAAAAAAAAAESSTGSTTGPSQAQVRALAYADRAVNAAPHLSACWRNRAAVHQRMGALTKAEEDYAIAIELEPIDPRLYVQRGGVIAAQWRRMKDAMTDFATALHLDENVKLS
jgi:tetratricopeptide (TPR) repeat protein